MIPADVLSALGRLNTHARARNGFGTEREAIYPYKTLAAAMLIKEGEASIRFVVWTGRCNKCTDGRWTPWWSDGDEKLRCRYCNGSGKVALRFTETTLPDGQVWHHPWNGRVMPGLDLARIVGLDFGSDGIYRTPSGAAVDWVDAVGWEPGQPTKPMPLAETVPLLNLVEDWVESITPWPRGSDFWWLYRSARRCLHRWSHRGVIGEPSHSYRLDLGASKSGCFLCGDTNDLADRYGRLTPLFHWSLPICKAHAAQRPPHPKDPPPDDLLTSPVREWLARHEQVREAE